MSETKDIASVTFYPPVTLTQVPFYRVVQKALQLEKLEYSAMNQLSEIGKGLLSRRRSASHIQHDSPCDIEHVCSSSPFSFCGESIISNDKNINCQHIRLSSPLSRNTLSRVLEKGQQCFQLLTSSYEVEDQQEKLVCVENRHRRSINREEATGWNLFLEDHKKAMIQTQIITDKLLVELEESRYRNLLMQEWVCFSGWAVKSEPEWRSAAQMATNQRLHTEREKHEARLAAENAAQEKERLRLLALDAIKNEQTNIRQARDAEVQRLKEEEIRMTNQIRERRRIQEQTLATLEEKDRQRMIEIQQEEELRKRAKEEEYQLLLAQEKSLEQYLLEKEREAERKAVEDRDHKYAMIIQAEEELSVKLKKSEEELKAKIVMKERAKQESMDEKYAKLLEEEYRLSVSIMERSEAKRAEEARVTEEERDRKLRLLEQAKNEEQRLLLAEKQREMTRKAEIERLKREEKRLREEQLMALLEPPQQHRSPQQTQYQPYNQQLHYR